MAVAMHNVENNTYTHLQRVDKENNVRCLEVDGETLAVHLRSDVLYNRDGGKCGSMRPLAGVCQPTSNPIKEEDKYRLCHNV